MGSNEVMMSGKGQSTRREVLAGAAAVAAIGLEASPASARGMALKEAIAQAAANDRLLAAFYHDSGYDTLWTGRGDRNRRKALLAAFDGAADHGLPTDRYPSAAIERALRGARSEEERGKLDVQLSQIFVQYARDISTGILDPRQLPKPLSDEIARRPLTLDMMAVLKGLRRGSPQSYIASLAPSAPEYARLVQAKIEMQKIAETAGWGPKVAASRLQPGDSGPGVISLRNRLMRMGYLRRTVSATYDDRIAAGVRAFQDAHGLLVDGVAGDGTMRMLNTSPDTRLSQIIVALERSRWMNFDLGARHVEVNIPDFSAKLVQNERVIFKTRAVVGQPHDDMRTPEFSDKIEYMVFNPSWYVPKTIAVDEYLPMLQEDPYSVSHLELLGPDGNPVDRSKVDFAAYNMDNWNLLLKEPPSQGNALGLVKFMFPNKYNIYLHDTPQKSLFTQQTRAYSHGCIRLQQPFDFADELLQPQTTDPQAFVKDALTHGEEYYVNLDKKLPVHIIYRTARVSPGGVLEFRGDIYGRDQVIFSQLRKTGVELRPA